MKFALCTISFRHQLISFSELVTFAAAQCFDGIELWGIHAENLFDHDRHCAEESLQHMREQGMQISMISDYLSIASEADFERSLLRCEKLIRLAQWTGAERIRTFAGQQASINTTPAERSIYASRLYHLCERCSRSNVRLLIEIHPGTLADSLSSTLQLLAEIGHPDLRLNFDIMHVWEFGGNILKHYYALEPWIDYFHLKNVASPTATSIFEPANVYAAAGQRDGMALLSEGIIDYQQLLRKLAKHDGFASLEWFGPAPLSVLQKEMSWLTPFKSQDSKPNWSGRQPTNTGGLGI